MHYHQLTKHLFISDFRLKSQYYLPSAIFIIFFRHTFNDYITENAILAHHQLFN